MPSLNVSYLTSHPENHQSKETLLIEIPIRVDQIWLLKHSLNRQAHTNTHTFTAAFLMFLTNSIYTDKTLSQIDYLLHMILSFTVKLWHGATSSHCFFVH